MSFEIMKALHNYVADELHTYYTNLISIDDLYDDLYAVAYEDITNSTFPPNLCVRLSKETTTAYIHYMAGYGMVAHNTAQVSCRCCWR